MSTVQPGVLPNVPHGCRYRTLSLIPGADPVEPLKALKELGIGEEMVVGIGLSLVSLLGAEIPGLKAFPSLVGPGVDIPATPAGPCLGPTPTRKASCSSPLVEAWTPSKLSSPACPAWRTGRWMPSSVPPAPSPVGTSGVPL